MYLGNPALRIHDYKEMSETLGTAIGAVTADKKVATKVILPIFTPANEGADGLSTWTEGHDDVAEQLTASHCDKDEVCTPMKYKGCYSSGRACPLDHSAGPKPSDPQPEGAMDSNSRWGDGTTRSPT